MNRPSRANEAVFKQAVEEITGAAGRLVGSLQVSTPARNRDEETRKARERSRDRFG
ncbi:MAG: DUF2277 family protein [Candidatus Sericytochromatia bacterium]|uniref:DUF2277 family protein n=1 Tax=Candidatus Tanganyikabacteria bacterium TaxID=2961651 RepID=A0A938BMR3_9BACT|nr:DUF2277 family protein [Candidatus Tanganyikabacteria bacterium]